MVSYKQLSAFVSVAQSATFAEAAEKVYLSQPALSSAIKKLEGQLGGQLFSRSTRKVTLSHEGREFLPVAIRLLNDWNDAVEDIQNLFAMRRGRMTLAAMPSFASSMLPKAIKRFLNHYPRVNITVMDVVMESVIQQVRDGRAEIGFTFENETLDGLDFQPLLENRFVAVMPAQHPLAHLEKVSWQQLSNCEFVAMNRGSSIREWIEQHLKVQSIDLKVVCEANQLSTLGEFVKQGLGVSVVPGICQTQFQANGLCCIELEDGRLTKQIGMIRASRHSLSVPAQAFWRQLCESDWV